VAALVLVTALQGCRSSAPGQLTESLPWPYGRGERPRFYMLYLPYIQNGVPLAMPSPYTSGWTDARMERDLDRLVAVGLDGLILALQPEVFTDALQTERVSRFLDLIESKGGPGFSVVLMLIPPSPAAAAVDAEALGRWLATHGLLQRAGLYRHEGRVMVLCSPEVTLSGPPHPALYAVRPGSPGATWTWGDPGEPARAVPTGPERQVLVHAGWRGRSAPVDAKGRPRWELERRGGLTLAAEIQNAYSAKAGLICISSWNNYVTGDFVEPNSLDEGAVLGKLAAVIRQAKEAAHVAPPPPAGTVAPAAKPPP
jgi:hypothetical protein